MSPAHKSNPMRAQFEKRQAAVPTGVLILALMMSAACAQYSIDWYKIGGGGASAGGAYQVNGTVGQSDAGGPMTGGNYSLTGGFWSLDAVPTPGAPTLFIAQSGTNAIISWPASASGFVLERNSDRVAANGWSAVIFAPVTTNGFNFVTNGITAGNNFYRLRHP